VEGVQRGPHGVFILVACVRLVNDARKALAKHSVNAREDVCCIAGTIAATAAAAAAAV
jgi:hypothetical protein